MKFDPKTFLQNFTPRIIRIFFSAAVLFAIFAAVFFARGLRFNFEKQEIFPTGVLKINSIPSGAAIFLDDKFTGFTPLLFRGIEIRPAKIRLEKSGRKSWEKIISIDAEKITALAPLLIPQKIIAEKLPENSTIFPDPAGRGILISRPEIAAVEIFDFFSSRRKVKFLPAKFNRIRPAAAGEFFVNFSDRNGKFTFFENSKKAAEFLAKENLRLSPDGKFLATAAGADLFLFSFETGKLIPVAKFPEKITAIFWPENSDSILTATSGSFFAVDSDGANLQKIFSRDANSALFFVKKSGEVFWRENNFFNHAQLF